MPTPKTRNEAKSTLELEIYEGDELIYLDPIHGKGRTALQFEKEHRDIAIYIKNAVNAHEALLSSLKSAREAMWLHGDKYNDHKASVDDLAKTAIAKAEEK